MVAADGADLTYQPDPNYCNTQPGGSPDTFTYTLAPGGSTATVRVTVTCVPDTPVAIDDTATVAEDSAATTIDVLANDDDPDPVGITIDRATQPTNGTVVVAAGGADLTYQPDPNYCNTQTGGSPDTFTYTLTPGGSTATVIGDGHLCRRSADRGQRHGDGHRGRSGDDDRRVGQRHRHRRRTDHHRPGDPAHQRDRGDHQRR